MIHDLNMCKHTCVVMATSNGVAPVHDDGDLLDTESMKETHECANLFFSETTIGATVECLLAVV